IMPANRQFPITGDGPSYMAKVALEGATLYNAASLQLSNIAGTANDVTAQVTPPLLAGIVDGMSFWWTAAATNTGPMTMTIGDAVTLDSTYDAATSTAPGSIRAGQRYLLHATLGKLVALGTVNSQKVNDVQLFDTAG